MIEYCLQKVTYPMLYNYINNAYLDLCRTLNFAEKTTNKTSTEKKKIEKTRKVFCDSIIGMIENMTGQVYAEQIHNHLNLEIL